MFPKNKRSPSLALAKHDQPLALLPCCWLVLLTTWSTALLLLKGGSHKWTIDTIAGWVDKCFKIDWSNNKSKIEFSFLYQTFPMSKRNILTPESQSSIRKGRWGASLVAQWLRVCLLMQGTRVRVLVWEDPTCRGATRSVSHNYWACASGACAPQQERPR